LRFSFFGVSGAHEHLGSSVSVDEYGSGGDVTPPAAALIRGSTPSHGKDEKLEVAKGRTLCDGESEVENAQDGSGKQALVGSEPHEGLHAG
jgi:hypothetical protein